MGLTLLPNNLIPVGPANALAKCTDDDYWRVYAAGKLGLAVTALQEVNLSRNYNSAATAGGTVTAPDFGTPYSITGDWNYLQTSSTGDSDVTLYARSEIGGSNGLPAWIPLGAAGRWAVHYRLIMATAVNNVTSLVFRIGERQAFSTAIQVGVIGASSTTKLVVSDWGGNVTTLSAGIPAALATPTEVFLYHAAAGTFIEVDGVATAIVTDNPTPANACGAIGFYAANGATAANRAMMVSPVRVWSSNIPVWS